MDTTAVRANAYQVLDRVLAEKVVGPGVRGTIYAVVDVLRSSGAQIEELRRAEGISIAIHRLEWAQQQRDEASSALALDELKALAASWLNSRICGTL